MKLKKIIEIKYQDNIINVDLDNATIIDGYIPILYTNKIGEDRYIVITSVIKEDGTVLVPFRKSIATKDEVDNYLFDNDISVYKNNKAIYKVSDDLFYVIDLEKTEFIKKDNKIIPVNPLLKMVCYYGIDDKKIIVYEKDCAYLYDVINNKRITPKYDFINPYEEYDNGYLAYYVSNNNKYSKPLILSFGKSKKDLFVNLIFFSFSCCFLRELIACFGTSSPLFRLAYPPKNFAPKLPQNPTNPTYQSS